MHDKEATPRASPLAGLTSYDTNHDALNTVTVGPVLGTLDWQEFVRLQVTVPEIARKAIVRVGLFGATERTSFDNISVQPSLPAELATKTFFDRP